MTKAVCGTTAITDPQMLQTVLYPSPTLDLIHIPVEGRKTVVLYNSDGELVRKIVTEASTISIADMAAGVYLLSIEDASGDSIISERVVKE